MTSKYLNVEFEDLDIQEEENESNELKDENQKDLESNKQAISLNDIEEKEEENEEENIFPETSFKLKLVANIESK